MVPVDEQMEVRLHLMLVKQLAESVTIGEVRLEVGHRVAQVDLIIEPPQQYLTHLYPRPRALAFRAARLLC